MGLPSNQLERILLEFTNPLSEYIKTWTLVYHPLFDGPLEMYENKEHIKIIREPIWDENSREIL